MRPLLTPFAALALCLATGLAPTFATEVPNAGGSADALVAPSATDASGIGVAARIGADGRGAALRLSIESSIADGLVLYAEAARREGMRGDVATLDDVEHETHRHYAIGALLPLPAARLRTTRLYAHARYDDAVDDVVDRLIVGVRAARATIDTRALTLSFVAAGELPGSRRLDGFGSLGLALVRDRTDIDVDGPNDVGTTLSREDDGIVPTFTAGLAWNLGHWNVHAAVEHAGAPAFVAGLRFGY